MRSAFSRLSGMLWLLFLVCLASSARAAPAPPTWEWRQHDLRQVTLELYYRQEPDIADCGGEATIRRELQSSYGYDIFTPAPPHVVLAPLPYSNVEVTVGSSGGRLHATVRFLDDAGRPTYPSRVLEEAPGRCHALLQEVAITVQLANIANIPPLPLEIPPGNQPPPPPVQTPSEAAQEPWRAHVNPSADFVIALGLAPGVAVGPAATAKVRVGPVWLALGVSALFPVEDGGEPRVQSAGLFLASAGPCLRGELFYGCALASAGFTLWRGANPRIVTRDDLTLLGIYSLRGGFDVPLVRGARQRTFTLGGYLEGGLHAFSQTQNLVTATHTERVSPPWPLFAAVSLSATLMF